MRKHLVIATYDGIGTHYSGVGTIAKNIVDALDESSNDLKLKVSIAYINVDKQSRVFNKQCFDMASTLVTKTGGHMIPLCNTTKGQSEWDMWRSFNEWNYACVSLVTALNLILNPNEENHILLNDTPFLFFAKYKDLVNDKNIKCFYFPLSTGKNHAFGDQEWRSNRIRVEQKCFDLISKDKNSKVVALGKRFAERMSEDYGLSFREEDFLQNGLFFDRYLDYLGKKFVNQDLKKFGIEIGKDNKLIFAWGRCSVAKGFKELARAWVKVYKQLPSHYLILQIPNNSGEPNYFSEVQEILSETSRYVVIDDFNPEIWKTVLRTENTDLVCIPSIMDPFPHTSIEAKLFSNGMNYITIISDVDGAVDAFARSESMYVDPRNTELFAQKIIEAITMDYKSRREIINRNKETINKFDFPKILEKFIKNNIVDI
ncbi:MAG: glycosyltransferase [bacterium]|nr:glycosyltransferase [bacterium]